MANGIGRQISFYSTQMPCVRICGAEIQNKFNSYKSNFEADHISPTMPTLTANDT